MFFNLSELIDHLTRPLNPAYLKWRRRQQAAAWVFGALGCLTSIWILTIQYLAHPAVDAISMLVAIAGNTVLALTGTWLAYLLGHQLFELLSSAPPMHEN